jgi:hypothetical protein
MPLVQVDLPRPLGVQLDESETPMGAMRYGGCFCRDCMAQFRAYLQRAAPGDPQLASLDLNTFDYRAFLLKRSFKAGDSPRTMPLYHHFCQFLVEAITATYPEMADYVRQYAASADRSVKVAGNFFNCSAEYDTMVAARSNPPAPRLHTGPAATVPSREPVRCRIAGPVLTSAHPNMRQQLATYCTYPSTEHRLPAHGSSKFQRFGLAPQSAYRVAIPVEVRAARRAARSRARNSPAKGDTKRDR